MDLVSCAKRVDHKHFDIQSILRIKFCNSSHEFFDCQQIRQPYDRSSHVGLHQPARTLQPGTRSPFDFGKGACAACRTATPKRSPKRSGDVDGKKHPPGYRIVMPYNQNKSGDARREAWLRPPSGWSADVRNKNICKPCQ